MHVEYKYGVHMGYTISYKLMQLRTDPRIWASHVTVFCAAQPCNAALDQGFSLDMYMQNAFEHSEMDHDGDFNFGIL